MASAAIEAPLPPRSADLLSREASAVSFDWARVAAHLSEHGFALDLGFAPRRLAGGLANVNILVRVNGDWAVFRRPPDGPIPKGAHDMAREHHVLGRLAPVLPLAPRSLHYCVDADVTGAHFQILEYRGGRIVRGAELAPLPSTPETGMALSRLLIETLTQIHGVDTAAAGLDGVGRPEGFLARTAAGWAARAFAVLDGQLSSACRELIAWLERRTPPDATRPTLLHNDFKLDNVVLRADVLAPEVVLDWDMATRGNPLFDLATLLSYWSEAGDPPCLTDLKQMPTAQPGFLSREAAAELYCAVSGRSLDGFLFPRVLALFKLGVVFHQLRTLRPKEQLPAVDPDDFFVFGLDVAHGRIF